MTVTMMELRTYGQCRTVLGGHGADTLFCGEATTGAKSYCAACSPRYYVKPPVIDLRRGQPKRKGRARDLTPA